MVANGWMKRGPGDFKRGVAVIMMICGLFVVAGGIAGLAYVAGITVMGFAILVLAGKQGAASRAAACVLMPFVLFAFFPPKSLRERIENMKKRQPWQMNSGDEYPSADQKIREDDAG